MRTLNRARNPAARSSNFIAASGSAANRRKELGQFLTPAAISSFMASLFDSDPAEIRLLDAGAGHGALTHAFVTRMCNSGCPPRQIAVTVYELDEAMIPELNRTLQQCAAECRQSSIEFSAELRHEDFIAAAASLVKGDLFGVSQTPFNAAILNPPYRKISSGSHTRRLLREAGIETSNLYTGFLALAAKLLGNHGEMVAICPRSFCNGPYFKPFRQQFLETMSLRRLHLFDSRSAAFADDGVLQENIIVHAMRSAQKPRSIIVSSSSGKSGGEVAVRDCAYIEAVSPSDPDSFIHLVPADSDEHVRRRMSRFSTTLAELGLDVSTGRVVEFRAKPFLVGQPEAGSMPMIYPCHFDGGFVRWPRCDGRKPNAIRDTADTQELLVRSAVYVLVKRFTTKEERRRVVACIYDPRRISAERVGFENHLNYFHAHGRGLPMELAKGLSAFLNSTVVDVYFRQFNGHTQVNAADLRSLRYPARERLEALGRKIGDAFPNQAELDALIETEHIPV